MEGETILLKLERIEQLLSSHNLLAKEILTFDEARQYLGISASTLYKKTSANTITHYSPNNKLIFFKRIDLNEWLLRNRKASIEEIGQKADAYVLKTKKA